MKKSEIRIGGHYTAKISGRIVTVRVDEIREVEIRIKNTGSGYRPRGLDTHYYVTNLATGRKTTFRSAAKFRSEVSAKEAKLRTDKLGQLLTEAGRQEREAEQRQSPNERRCNVKKSEIEVGGLYTARVSGKFVTVRVDAICETTRQCRGCCKQTWHYEVTNLITKRKITFRSAAKLRAKATKVGEGKSKLESGKSSKFIRTPGRFGEEVDPLAPEDSCPFVEPTSLTAVIATIPSSASRRVALPTKVTLVKRAVKFRSEINDDGTLINPQKRMEPQYVCWKCSRKSWLTGGLPICVFCNAKARTKTFENS